MQEFSLLRRRGLHSVHLGKLVFRNVVCILKSSKVVFNGDYFVTRRGKLTNKTSADLQEIAAKAAFAAANIDPKIVDSTVIGNVISVRLQTIHKWKCLAMF